MKYEIIELEEFKHHRVRVYSIYDYESEEVLLDSFVNECDKDFKDEVDDILTRLEFISEIGGLRSNFYKKGEGALGDGVCALYDKPDSNLRLYFIKISSCIIILGGGGVKPKNIRAYQEDEKLLKAAEYMKEVSRQIVERQRSNEISIDQRNDKLIGNLIFNEEE